VVGLVEVVVATPELTEKAVAVVARVRVRRDERGAMVEEVEEVGRDGTRGTGEC
jgi:hypothetical protein